MTVSIIRRDVPDHDLPSDLHPVIAQIYASRHLLTANEIEHSLKFLHPSDSLKSIDKAIALLVDAVHKDLKVLIVADFDADGATSCALTVRALHMLGLTQVEYLVPNRFEFGYGLTKEIVAVAAKQNPDLIITVDNGISSIEGVQAANDFGIQVLITDHHLPGEHLPAANAIVNPNQPGDTFPSKNLAGVGVIFYVMFTLRSALREAGWFEKKGIEEPNLASLLDLVALGTVADVVPMDHNNRILVSQGLARIRHGQCIPGISALIAIAKRNQKNMVAADLGFAVGPRLNAAGRLEDMSLGIECLLTDDLNKARAMAKKLDQLNIERREIENKMQVQAVEVLKSMQLNEDDKTLPVGLCLFDESWHQGVIGILASRIKEKLHRPVIAFAPCNDKEIKGSARSVQGLHIRDVLDAVAAKHPVLLKKFGGHAMAAGMLLDKKNFESFSKAFDEEVRRVLSEEDLQGVIHTDGELQATDIGLPLAQLIRQSGPWGQCFPEPVFEGEFELIQKRIVGEKHLKLMLKVPDHDVCIDAIAFNMLDKDWPDDVRRVSTAYRLDVNEYQGRVTPQLIVEHIAPI